MKIPRTYPQQKQNLIPRTGVFPLGYIAGSKHSGVKKNGFNDVTVVVSPKHEIKAASVFTTNRFCAAPVKVSKDIIKNQTETGIFGVVVNSGCANAGTGERGLKDAKVMSNVFGKPCLVMSTGVIGQPLAMEKVLKGLKESKEIAGSGFDSWMSAAEGIMTTDTFPKLHSKEFTTPSGIKYRMAGWSKGAGMIHPNMATMLSAVFTDCNVSLDALSEATRFAADRSFNSISIDGDTSTNDTFAVVANGAQKMSEIDLGTKEFEEFQSNLTEFSLHLAQLIVRDGEGATKFIEVKVTGASSSVMAKLVANAIVKSPLVKTAFFGKDANWGRIICAVGYSGAEIDTEKVNLKLSPRNRAQPVLHLFKDGAPFNVSEEIAAEILEEEDLLLHVDLGLGNDFHTMFTCDLSHEYVSINADYRS